VADRREAILDAAISAIARRGVRGLRVEEVAETAGVAVSLLYYYFGSRSGLVRATLDHANERASGAPAEGGSGYEQVERTLLAEFDAPKHVRDTSVVWGEVLASAVFEPELREQVAGASAAWMELVADRIRAGREDGSIRRDADPRDAAERLTALVDGLSARWLAGLLERKRARSLLADAVRVELRPQQRG
jgi:AcrR family transcriptional regulator